MKTSYLRPLLFVFLLSCNADTVERNKSVSLFDGESLKGWKPVNPVNTKFWSVSDGMIEASNGEKKMPVNTYLATTAEYENFEFTCDFKLTGDHATGLINSGIQYRSLLVKKKIAPLSLVTKLTLVKAGGVEFMTNTAVKNSSKVIALNYLRSLKSRHGTNTASSV